MEAARWGLFFEKVGPILHGLRETQALKVNGDTPGLAEILAQKQDAAELIPLLESLIYPEDTDG